jgi:hypothetical protein
VRGLDCTDPSAGSPAGVDATLPAASRPTGHLVPAPGQWPRPVLALLVAVPDGVGRMVVIDVHRGAAWQILHSPPCAASITSASCAVIP